MLPLVSIAASLIQFAPVLAGLLGGPKAEAVAAVAADVARAVTGQSDNDSAVAALRNSPELALQYQQAMNAREVELARIAADTRREEFHAEVAIAQADASDRSSARSMHATLQSWAPAIISMVVLAGFLGILVGVMAGFLSISDNQVLLVLVGNLAMGFGQVLNFWLGSSEGSKRKSAEMLQVRSRPDR